MMKNQTLYCPRTGNPLTSQREYYSSVFSKVKEKLSGYLDDDIPNVVPPTNGEGKDNYLTRIQRQLEEKYGINP